jgi:DNA-binding transcriptional LysR family regulator
MTLEALRCLCAVVEARSFRGAGERLGRTQSAVSQQIKTLEQESGQVLLDRRTAQPTPAGQLLYERARRIVSDADGLARELRDFDEAAATELRVGTSDTTALYVLPGAVRAFSKEFPQTRLRIVNRSSDGIAEQVRRGELDLGIVTLPLGHGDLHEQELFHEDLVLVTPPSHRLAGQNTVSLSALKEEPLLLLETGTRTGALLREHFRRKGFVPQVALTSGSFEVIKRYVAEGIGVAFLPELTLTPADTRLSVLRVPGLPRVCIGAIWRKGAYQTRPQQAFLALLTR